MAENFLGFSKSYVNGTRKDLLRRREVVGRHLKDNCTAGRNKDKAVFAAVKAELHEEGVGITKAQYNSDKLVLRSAFLFLTAETPADQDKLLADFKRTKNIPGLSAVNHLIEDGIRNFGDVERLKASSVEEAPAPAPTSQETPQAALKRQANALVDIFEAVLAENAQLKSDADYMKMLEDEVRNLETRTRELRILLKTADATTLEQIAERNPEFPQLFAIVQTMKKKAARRPQDIEALRKGLPKTFNWPNERGGNIEYKDPFLTELAALEKAHQERVIKQVGVLATHGPWYGSLDTSKYPVRRVPFTPRDCFGSRASDDLRFSWKKNGAVTIYWLWRKSDKRVTVSEK